MLPRTARCALASFARVGPADCDASTAFCVFAVLQRVRLELQEDLVLLVSADATNSSLTFCLKIELRIEALERRRRLLEGLRTFLRLAFVARLGDLLVPARRSAAALLRPARPAWGAFGNSASRLSIFLSMDDAVEAFAALHEFAARSRCARAMKPKR